MHKHTLDQRFSLECAHEFVTFVDEDLYGFQEDVFRFVLTHRFNGEEKIVLLFTQLDFLLPIGLSGQTTCLDCRYQSEAGPQWSTCSR